MKKFEDIYGNRRVLEKLKSTAISGDALNSYVFEGLAGIGKKTTAEIFAAALLCENKQNTPCGMCPTCAKTATHNHPDIIYVRKKKDKATLGIDDVREQIMETVYVKPLLSGYKIYLIEEGDLLTVGAQNGLLKILEEPPSYAVFITMVSKASLLLDTVLSRSVRLAFLPLAEEETLRYFREHTDAEVSKQRFAARFSQGIVGRGLKILEDEEYAELFETTVRLMDGLLRGNAVISEFERFILEHKEKTDFITDIMLVFLRDCVFVSVGKDEKILLEEREQAIRQIAGAKSKKALVAAMDAVLLYQKRLSQNANGSCAALDLLMSIREEMNVKSNRSQI